MDHGCHGEAQTEDDDARPQGRRHHEAIEPAALQDGCAVVTRQGRQSVGGRGGRGGVHARAPLDVGGETATGLLEKQHREVEKLFGEVLGTEDARTRRSTTTEIIDKLTMHTKIEETIFYPAVRGIDTEEAKDLVLEAYEEHHVVKMILKELPKLDPKADNFEAKMTVLKEMVEHHVDEEEKEMFPMAERKLGADRSRALAERMASRAARE